MFRILPFVIILLVTVIGSKIMELSSNESDFINSFSIFEVKDIKAEDKPATSAHAKEEKASSIKKKSEPLEHIDNPANKSAAPKPEESSGGYTGDPMNPADQLKKEEDKDYTERPTITPVCDQFSPTELEVLQSLKSRREALAVRENDVSFKENTLTALDKTIDTKLRQLSDVKTELNGILTAYQKRDDEKMSALVKVYETMKPQDAAAIFAQLEMPILLDVAERMKEVKFAAILAKMEPYRAKEVTVELANRRRLSNH